ncbi:hypothetical protein H7K15_14995 [Mycobacterium parmense]|nr:hypothetical protein [Mycobacterium parmense]ORW60941.1 hypothetical protein AWC20_08420 [Mycobacterium parmense]
MQRCARAFVVVLIGAGGALGFGGSGTAPAGADPNPFSTLGCGCPETAPTGTPARRDEITLGIRQGIVKWLPRPRPGEPSTAR